MASLLHADVSDIALWGLAGNGRESPAELRGAHGQFTGQLIHIDTIGFYLIGNDSHRLGEELLVLLRQLMNFGNFLLLPPVLQL